jgi:hypothetical protein
MPYSRECLEGVFSETGPPPAFLETEGMYMYLALNKSGSGAYHSTGKQPGALLRKPIGEIGGERERRSWAPGNDYIISVRD